MKLYTCGLFYVFHISGFTAYDVNIPSSVEPHWISCKLDRCSKLAEEAKAESPPDLISPIWLLIN